MRTKHANNAPRGKRSSCRGASISPIYYMNVLEQDKSKFVLPKPRPLVLTQEILLLQLLAPKESYNHEDVRDRGKFFSAIFAMQKHDKYSMYSIVTHKEKDIDPLEPDRKWPKGFTVYRLS